MIGNKIYMADQGPDAVLISSEINFPVPVEPEIPAETPAEGGESSTPVAPTTADTGLVAASLLLVAAAAVVLKARKH
jgi:hypothetical protein